MKETRFEFFSDNLKLVGLLDLPENPADKIIILCHGIGYDKNEYKNFFVNVAEFFCKAGFSVLRFDFRGHGESEGKQEDMTPTGEANDIDSSVSFAKSKGFSKIGILGMSFGGGSTLLSNSMQESRISALALWAPTIDYNGIFNSELRWPKKYFGPENLKRLEEHGYMEIGGRKFRAGKNLVLEMKSLKPWTSLEKIKFPVMFFHGENDDIVSCEYSKKYAKMFGKPIEIIKGAGHGDEKFLETALPKTLKFFKQNLK